MPSLGRVGFPTRAAAFFPTQPIIPILDGFGLARTMEINARVISGLDPGAIPGGSTILSRVIAGSEGPISIDRRLKVFAFSRPDPPLRVIKLNANDNFAEEFAVAA